MAIRIERARGALLCGMLGAVLSFVPVAEAGPVSTTAAEEATLRSRGVVIRELPTREDGAVRVLALVDIAAGAGPVWDALLDFEGRKANNPAITSVSAYRPDTATERHVRWELSKFGFTVIYHNRYELDRDEGRMTHTLDATRQNDLTESRGVYEVYPSPAGAGITRLTWEVESDFGSAIPGFVQKWMTTSATRDFMADMARRAEVRASR